MLAAFDFCGSLNPSSEQSIDYGGRQTVPAIAVRSFAAEAWR